MNVLHPEGPVTREAAQARADRIRAFREELRELAASGVAVLPDELGARIRAHQDDLLAGLAARFDVDRTEAEKQLSLGTRIASLLGAVALSFAVFFFFYRIWGAIPTGAQVALLIATPILGTVGTEIAARKERTLYVAAIFALVAVSGFGLMLMAVGQLFNIGASSGAFLALGIFAGIIAYTYGMRLLLVIAMVACATFLAGTVNGWFGAYWGSFLQKPETLFLPGAALLAIPAVTRHARSSFQWLYRGAGLLAFCIPILILANVGSASWIDLPAGTVEIIYQVIGFPLGALAIWAGVRRQWKETTVIGTVYFIILLYIKFFDWWWAWMPKWLFFLALGAIAVGTLVLLKRLQRAARTVSG